MTPEFAVEFRDMLCESFKNEMKTTAKVLAAIPEEQSSYKPDPKAKSAFELAWHIAAEDVKFLENIAAHHFEFGVHHTAPATMKEMLAWYQEHFTQAVEKIKNMSAEELLTPINFAGMFNFPAYVYLMWMNNHSIHHRGQLSTYLRPMGSKVPGIYGGSADEEFPMPQSASA